MAAISLFSLSSFAAKVAKEEVTTIRCHITIYYSDGSVTEHFYNTTTIECHLNAWLINNGFV